MVLFVGQKVGMELFLLDGFDKLVDDGGILLVGVDFIAALHCYYYAANHTSTPNINNPVTHSWSHSHSKLARREKKRHLEGWEG